MTTYRLIRPGGTDIEFDGVMLANLTSRTDGALRWSEVRIYRTASGKYVTETVGPSLVKGEKVRGRVEIHEDASTITKGLEREGKRGPYLTDLAVEALEVAGANDAAIRALLVERI